MIDIKKYCEYLYNSLLIPIYVYDNKELIACYPNQKTTTLPQASYLFPLLESNKKVNYIITKFYSYYGYIEIENSNSCIIIGPVSNLPYNREVLFSIHKEFSVEKTEIEEFDNFFFNIPRSDLVTFINTLLFINYTINNTELIKNNVEHDLTSLQNNSIIKKYVECSYTFKEEGYMMSDYSVETELFRHVETGNLEGLKNFFNKSVSTKVGVVADNNLRQLKNIFIVTITLASRAAMKGGLTPSIAYNLSDIYIQQVERLTNMDAINSLLYQALFDFTSRTANSIIPPNADNIFHQVVKYVRENTNKDITVEDIADHIGYNRSYLSRKFIKETGIDLSSFIRKCKLEEAKDLLAYSDKSIGEISNFLCFSNQSHFQRAFKNQFGITPQAYRKSK